MANDIFNFQEVLEKQQNLKKGEVD